jgi:hypothetical protein
MGQELAEQGLFLDQLDTPSGRGRRFHHPSPPVYRGLH